MTAEIYKILHFMLNAFLHIWPYLIITIPIAVAVNMSGASKHIKRAFDAGPLTAILLATLVGAFSPFCSCGVIPVIAALLIGGVPLPPVMAFWIASPSMDPEIFFLSVATIGWDLAIWRLVGTMLMSLSAGFITYALMQNRWIQPDILKHKARNNTSPEPSMIKQMGGTLFSRLKDLFPVKTKSLVPAQSAASCSGEPANIIQIQDTFQTMETSSQSCCSPSEPSCGCPEEESFKKRLIKESLDATLLVIKFMALAFFLEALIILYVPKEWIITILGQENALAIPTAALLGVPVYTSTISALPMASGLLKQGMGSGAALAFLVAGPTTTLPAMAAVWTLVKYRIFVLYVSFSLLGAILLGYANQLWGQAG